MLAPRRIATSERLRELARRHSRARNARPPKIMPGRGGRTVGTEEKPRSIERVERDARSFFRPRMDTRAGYYCGNTLRTATPCVALTLT